MKAPALSLPFSLAEVALLSVLALLLGAAPASAQQGSSEDPLVDGLTVGGGLVFYQGDLDANPDGNILKYLGSSRPSFFAQADRRYGAYRLGLELSYDRVSGERQFNEPPAFSFSNNLVGLSAVGSIDFGVPSPDLFRLFAGVGPMLFVSPSYDGFQEYDETVGFSESEEFRDEGTRVQPSFMLGLNVQDAVRIGGRFFPTNYVDGFKGASSEADFLVFVNLVYRFDFTE